MSLQKVTRVFWHCVICNFVTNVEPLNQATRCPACGHDEVMAKQPIFGEKAKFKFKDPFYNYDE